MGRSTPDPDYELPTGDDLRSLSTRLFLFTYPVLHVGELDRKLREWQQLLEEDNTTPVRGYERQMKRRSLPPSNESFQTPPLSDPMDPPRYWKALTESESKKLDWMDAMQMKNPQYWEMRFRLVCDTVETLEKSGYDWKLSQTGCGKFRTVDKDSNKLNCLGSPPATSPSSSTLVSDTGGGLQSSTHRTLQKCCCWDPQENRKQFPLPRRSSNTATCRRSSARLATKSPHTSRAPIHDKTIRTKRKRNKAVNLNDSGGRIGKKKRVNGLLGVIKDS